MRLSDLLENNAQEMADAANLKARLLQPGTVEVSGAGYDTTRISLGHLEHIGAGRILRGHPSYKGNWFGFHYGTELDGQPIRATLKVGNRLMKPGQKFLEEF